MRITSKLVSDAMEVGYLISLCRQCDTSATEDFIKIISSRRTTPIDPVILLDDKVRAISSIVSRYRRQRDITEFQRAFINLIDDDASAYYAAKLSLLDEEPIVNVSSFELAHPSLVVDSFKAGILISSLDNETKNHETRPFISGTTEEMVYLVRLRVIRRIVLDISQGLTLTDDQVTFCRLLSFGDLDFKYSSASYH